MFAIELYVDACGVCPLRDFLKKQDQNPAAQAWMNKFDYCVARLRHSGTRVGSKFTKHLRDGIWELRVGDYRIPFFLQGNTVVLLHAFYKDTNKTPQSEIKRALKEREEWTRNHEPGSGE
jgi:phage-related protein